MAKEKKSKEEQLNPQIEKVEEGLNKSLLDDIKKAIELEKEIRTDDDTDTADSFFKSIISALFDTKKNLSGKTEYIDVQENYNGMKLEWLGVYGQMPYLNRFIEIFESKRISLERKGRIEIIKGLQRREEELRMQEFQNRNELIGGNQIR